MRLTKEEIVAAWNEAVPESKDKGIEMYLHLMQAVADAQYRKCALSLESVRSEALWNEEIEAMHAMADELDEDGMPDTASWLRDTARRLVTYRKAQLATAPESPAKEQPGEQNVVNWTTEGCPKHNGQSWTMGVSTVYTQIAKRCPLCEPPPPERP